MNQNEISFQEIGGVPVIQVRGYFNAEVGPQVSKIVDDFLRIGKIGIVLDLSQCNVVNSPGISSLIDLTIKIMDDFRGKLIISGLDQLKITVFTTAGLLPMADVANDAQEACSKLKS